MKQLAIVPPELTKAAISEAGVRYASELLDAGDQDILVAYIRLRALKDAIDSALEEMQSEVEDEVDQYPVEDRKKLGVAFRNQGGNEQYDFSHDSVWKENKAAEKLAADIRKKREKFLKGLEKEMVDKETGEIVSPATVRGYTKRSVALTFPKE